MNFVTILLQQVCIRVVRQPCDKSDTPVKLVKSCFKLVDNRGQTVKIQLKIVKL